MGIHAYSRSVGQSQPQRRPWDGCQCVEAQWDRAVTGAQQTHDWSTFLKAHWKVLAASDFLTVEVWTAKGLVTHYLLFVISLADRIVNIVGITTRPDESWMLQIARNMTDAQSGALHSKRYLIIDRDTKYSEQFRRLIRDAATEVIRLPPRSPNLNAYAERFVRSIKDECLDRLTTVRLNPEQIQLVGVDGVV